MSKATDKIVKSLGRKSASILTKGAKFNEELQAHILAILEFIKEHGNSTPAADLVKLVTRPADKKALVSWFKTHANLNWQEAKPATEKHGAKEAVFKKSKNPENFEINMDAAIAEKWYDIKKETANNAPRKAYNGVSRLASVIKSFQTAMATPSVEGDVMPVEMLEELKAVFLKYGGQVSDISIPTTDNVVPIDTTVSETVKSKAA